MDTRNARQLGKRIELVIQRFLFASRWVLVPFYLGLALALLVLLVKFVQEFVHVAASTFSGSEAEIILGVLSLVDFALTGSLIVIVIFSGYENFVSRIDPTEHTSWPTWMASIDFTGLKLKLLSSIVAISGVQLLKQFMAVKTLSDRDLFWYVAIHLTFVASNLLLALSDRITASHHATGAEHAGEPAAPAQAKDGRSQ